MGDDGSFLRIFGEHRRRTNEGNGIRIRDDLFIGDLKARLSGLAARDNRANNSGWLIDFSPVRTDPLTERSLFTAILASDRLGTREMTLQVGRDWVEVGDGAMESAVRGNIANIDTALTRAFHRVVLRSPSGTVDARRLKFVDA